tara:strand:- start:251 stop:544 length:294 start_codon:yes stop_codon:yes gene_type:complete
MGIFIDTVTVYCEAKCCDNKVDVLITEGNLKNYTSNYADPVEELRNEIADTIFPWTTSGRLEGFEDDVLCPSCIENINELNADISKLKSKLSNYEGI